VYVNVETAQTAREDVGKGMQAILSALGLEAQSQLGDPFPDERWPGILKRAGEHGALNQVLSLWAFHSKRPLVLLIDEIDSLIGDTLISVLRQLRAGYPKRPAEFPKASFCAGFATCRTIASTLQASKVLLGLLVLLTPPGTPLIIGVDETIERRKGRKIKARGVYRDAVRSSEKHVVKCFGLKWISMMLIVPLPWAKRCWALPFLTVPAHSEACNRERGKPHKTTVDWTRRMIMQVSRWVANRAIVLVGDGAYAAVALAHCCAGLPNPVLLVSRLRLDAALFDPPPPPSPGKRGRKPKKGGRQPSLEKIAKDPSTRWSSLEIVWYDGDQAHHRDPLRNLPLVHPRAGSHPGEVGAYPHPGQQGQAKNRGILFNGPGGHCRADP